MGRARGVGRSPVAWPGSGEEGTIAVAMKRALGMSLCALCFVSLAACGGARDGAEKELEALRTEIVKLRNETALLADRVGALERPSAKSPGEVAAGGAQDALSERPPLEVVRLAPGSSQSSQVTSGEGGQGELALLDDAALDEEDDEASRPILRSAPGGAVIEEKPRKGAAMSKTPKVLGAARSVKAGVPR